jgi:hypothetical protein
MPPKQVKWSNAELDVLRKHKRKGRTPDGLTLAERVRRHLNKRAQEERDIAIPECKNPERKANCIDDIVLALNTYFTNKFTDRFTSDQIDLINEICYRAKYGGDKAEAAPRGGGKTTIAECVILLLVLKGVLRFPIIVCATAEDAESVLGNIKSELERNELLYEDYPEVCAPVRELAGSAARARMQTARGSRTWLVWQKHRVILPDIKGSRCGGSVIETRGCDAAIRGVRRGAMRPDFILVDDAETRESVESQTQTQKRKRIIDQDLAGLGGPGVKIARLMLCTIMRHDSLAAQYTDRKMNPGWSGSRRKLLVQKPDREDLWDQYILLLHEGARKGDLSGRKAMQFYESRRDDMDAGAKVSAPDRYIETPSHDGTPIEISPIQHCYNWIAKIGEVAFETEYNNSPPAESLPEESGISASIIQSSTNGNYKGFVPEDATIITAAIDVGKYYCHYVVGAWLPGATGHVIDYGVIEVHNANQEGTENAIRQALHSWREEVMAEPYKTQDGEEKQISIVLVDAGNWDTTIYSFCGETGGRLFRASKGFGSAHRQSPFRSPRNNTKTRLVGEHWYVSMMPDGTWLHGLDSDYWKRWVHDRFLTPVGRPGSLSLWGADAREHMSYGKHLTAETEIVEFVPGKGERRFWKREHRNNHWFDSTYMMCAAASMVGVGLLQTQPIEAPSLDSGSNAVIESSDRTNKPKPRRRWSGT